MEDDRSRLSSPLKTKWNLIFQNILESDDNSHLLNENHLAIHRSLEELNRSLHQLSQNRHNLNCRLEYIKQEMEKLQSQLDLQSSSDDDKIQLEQEISKLKDEGYLIQVELKNLEGRLKKIRSPEPQNSY